MPRLLRLAAMVAVVLAACAAPVTPSPVTSPALALATTPATTPAPTFNPAHISVENGTTVPIAIAVNGTILETLPPGTTEDPLHATLPAMPWTVDARSPSGRVLATLTIGTTDGLSITSGRFAGGDLACGRLWIWAGASPGGGPSMIPDPSKPCD